MRKEVLIAGFVLLGALAVAGWTRKPTPAWPQAGIDQPATPAAFSTDEATPAAAAAARPATAVPAVHRAPARTRSVAAREPVSVPQRTVRRSRPLSHSVAIVAASAGTGAAIGALAGKGRGAAIGALAGGGAGFLYDRLTRNR